MQNQYFVAIRDIVLMALASFGMLLSLRYSKNYWANSIFFTMSTYLLPQIGYIITKIISGNIALSLGMVGALSIIRFRHPVKNSLELVTYFALISMGIATTISFKYGLLQGILFSGTITVIHFLRIRNSNDYNRINALNSCYILEASSKNEIDFLFKSSQLNYFEFDSNLTLYKYRLIFQSRAELDEILKETQGLESLSKVIRKL